MEGFSVGSFASPRYLPPMVGDPKEILALIETRMPFGKYSGVSLVDLPEDYLVWFSKRGFPQGSLGKKLEAVYEIKLNGLEYLLKPLRV
jgi:uncharacterized protein